MKNQIKNLFVLLFSLFIIIIIVSSCEKDDEKEQFLAVITIDTVYSIGDTVWLDASQSTGASDFNEEWELSGPELNNPYIPFDELRSLHFFVPEKNGSYSATLTITSGNRYNTATSSFVVSGAIKLGGTITENTTLKDLNNFSSSSDDADYILTENLIIDNGAYLYVEPYTKIQAPDGVGIVVKNGYINAYQVTFTSATTWKGIHVMSGTAGFYLCTVENAGDASFTSDSEESAAIYVDASGNLGASSCTFKNSGGYGIYFHESGNVTSTNIYVQGNSYEVNFAGNIFESNVSGPFKANLDVLQYAYGGMDFTNETVGSHVIIRGGEYYQNIAFVDYGLPFMIDGLIDVNGTVIISAGVELIFGADAGILAENSLQVGSSSGGETILRGATPGSGYWKGLAVVGNGQNPGASISNASISDAGSSSVIDGDTIIAAIFSEYYIFLDNVAVEQNDGIGVVARTIDVRNSTFSDNKGGSVQVEAPYLSQVIESSRGNTFTGWPSAATIIVGPYRGDNAGQFGDDITLPDLDGFYDYLFTHGNVQVPNTKTLTIEAGAYIQFDAGRHLDIQGSIQAVGTNADNIYLTGKETSAGYWAGVSIKGTAASTLDYVHVEYAGTGYDEANLYIGPVATDVTVTNSVIINSSTYGVVADNNSVSAINDVGSNNTLGGNSGGYQQN